MYKSRLIVKSVLRKHFCHADCINARIIIITTIIDHILRIFKINNTKPIDDKKNLQNDIGYTQIYLSESD